MSSAEQQRDNLKTAAYAILGIDAFLCTLWFIGIIVIFVLDCRALLFVTHILLLLHFGTQSVSLVAVLDEYTYAKEEADVVDRKLEELQQDRHVREVLGAKLKKMRKTRRLPLAWLIASIVSFLGDLYLLANDVLNYVNTPDSDCRKYIIFELLLESMATTATILSIVWFIALSVVHEQEKKRLAALVAPLPTTPKAKQMVLL